MRLTTAFTAFLSLSVITATGCNSTADNNGKKDKKDGREAKADTVTTDSGLKYIIWKKGEGEKADKGDNVSVHYAGRLLTGEPFDNSYDRGRPFDFPLGGGRVIKGWDEGIAYLNVGDSATLIIPANLGYGSMDRPNIPANSTLIFDVELMNVKKVVKPVPFDVTGKDTLSTASGLRYIKTFETKGAQAQAGKNVSVHYTGYLENGNIFDSSISRGQPIAFPLGQGRVIKGWDEGIALLRVGEKARLIIPSELGYGEAGAGGLIPPNATLIFDVELVELK